MPNTSNPPFNVPLLFFPLRQKKHKHIYVPYKPEARLCRTRFSLLCVMRARMQKEIIIILTSEKVVPRNSYSTPRNKKTGGAHVCTSVENLLLFASAQPRTLTKANLTSNLWQVISKLIPILSCLCAGLRDTLQKKHATSPDSLAGYR